jgi:hypothetical protein
MTIKGVLVLGEFGYKNEGYLFDNKIGLVKINGLQRTFNFKKSLLNKEFFIIPIMNEFGMNIESINDSFSINESYINSSSILINNQYIKDNELMSELSVTTSQFKIQVTIPRILDNKGYFLSNPLQKIAKGYIDLLRYNFKESYITKNILQFKNSRGDNNLFLVHNLPNMIQFIDEYQVELKQNKGSYQGIIKVSDSLIKFYKNNKDEDIPVESAYHKRLFFKELAELEISFENNTFNIEDYNKDNIEDYQETILSQTQMDIDLDRLIQLCNIYYQTGVEVYNVDTNKLGQFASLVCMTPIKDFSQVTYLDTSGNVILAGKLTGISKSQAIASGNTLDLYDITISPKMSSGFIAPALLTKNYIEGGKKNKKATKELKKTEKLGRDKTTFDTLK